MALLGGVSLNKKEKIARLICVLLCEAFAGITVIMLLVNKQYDRLPLAVATPFIILAPKILEWIFCCKISMF